MASHGTLQTLPRSNKTSKITTTKPRPPLG
jgi:hypothetical protein